jgi:hypothetical protein
MKFIPTVGRDLLNAPDRTSRVESDVAGLRAAMADGGAGVEDVGERPRV